MTLLDHLGLLMVFFMHGLDRLLMVLLELCLTVVLLLNWLGLMVSRFLYRLWLVVAPFLNKLDLVDNLLSRLGLIAANLLECLGLAVVLCWLGLDVAILHRHQLNRFKCIII